MVKKYLTLNEDGLGQGYKFAILDEEFLAPADTLLAVYSGLLERVLSGEEDVLNHSMNQGRFEWEYDLHVDGTPRCDLGLGTVALARGACNCLTTAAHHTTML
jgi:hypothetical protein